MKLGGIEAGGTKMVLAVGDENGTIEQKITIPTETPDATVPKMIEFFRNSRIEALGIGCFGPVDLNRNSRTYGYITTTPKLIWGFFDFAGAFRNALRIPVGFDLDVNAAVLGEATWGAARGCEVAIYITIGTGIGVGVSMDGHLLHGLIHPEAGHLILAPHPEDSYKGHCPYHGNCFEGMASGPAIEERWGRKAAELADQPKVWELESYYVAEAVANYMLCYSPNRVILGGGVMHQRQMFPMVRDRVQKMLNGYLSSSVIKDHIDEYIVAPGLGDEAGIKGALRLAWLELAGERSRRQAGRPAESTQ